MTSFDTSELFPDMVAYGKELLDRVSDRMAEMTPKIREKGYDADQWVADVEWFWGNVKERRGTGRQILARTLPGRADMADGEASGRTSGRHRVGRDVVRAERARVHLARRHLWLGWLGDLNIPRIPGETGGPDAVTVPVLREVTRRPLQLRCESFRAIGWDDKYAIEGRHVKFVPEVLGRGTTSSSISVSMAALPDDARKRTIVYEGRVVDRNGKDVCDPIHFVKPADFESDRRR